jgi:hypothetical protein
MPAVVAALCDALQLHAELPQHIRHRAVLPRSALCAQEPSLGATRLRAFDAEGRLCLYWHTYTLAEVDFDAEDLPYVRVSLRETVTAVRTDAGTWLQRTQRWRPEQTAEEEDSGYRVSPRFLEA